MGIPGYDGWKLATPPEYDELGPEEEDCPEPEETEAELHDRLDREYDEAQELVCAEADRKEGR